MIRINGTWTDVMNAARFTVGKSPLQKSPSKQFKEDMVISEHSPLRLLHVVWSWTGIKHWVGVHFTRHKWECFVATQRSDRTGTPRDKLPQDQPSNFMGEANPQHLIDTSRKRLCRKASPETREQWESLKVELRNLEPEIADAMVPNCIYRCGCPEADSCGVFHEWCTKLDPRMGCCNIKERYRTYNNVFYREHVLHGCNTDCK